MGDQHNSVAGILFDGVKQQEGVKGVACGIDEYQNEV